MLKKEITFTNYNDEEVTVTEYFNLNKTQTMRLVSGHGGMDKYLQSIIDKKDASEFINFVEELVLTAYGKRDENDPAVFDNSKEVKDAFAKTPQFDELVYTLLSNEKEFMDFFYGILPRAMQEKVREAEANAPQLKQNA